MKRKFLIVFCFLFYFIQISSQETDSLLVVESLARDYKFSFRQLTVPVSLIVLGSLGVCNKHIDKLNNNIKEDIAGWRKSKYRVDDYLQYLPVASVYGLSLTGVRAKSNYSDRTFVVAVSYLSMGIMVRGGKLLTHVQRPDSRAKNSFPSGHTATAFMGAELIRNEYSHNSIWYGIGAYTVACGIGVLRIYNERHWTTDVIAGAGVGILSARIGYWLLPVYKKVFRKPTLPLLNFFYNGQETGFCFALHL